jgi:hypothetical protein
MKRMIFLALILGSFCLALASEAGTIFPAASGSSPLQERKLPEIIQLAATSRLGAVSFNHADHATKNFNIEGTAPIACVECHHTEQPAAEVAKHPPLKTAWPADRTTTLTADLLKDPKAPEVVGCRSCHSATGAKPKMLPEIPQMKSETSTAIITLNNQQAFHRGCAGCHDQVVKTRANAKAPTSQKCASCHKK